MTDLAKIDPDQIIKEHEKASELAFELIFLRRKRRFAMVDF